MNVDFSGFCGNEQALFALRSMISTLRMPHSLLLCGDTGTGRKTLAARLALSLTDGENAYAHPDIRWVEKSGKLGGFPIERVREICTDAYVMPNNGDRKVYIFADCASMDARVQNTLLKIIEEPPEPVYFIFTAVTKTEFLPTVLSRTATVELHSCTDDECRAELRRRGFDDCEKAVSIYGGNIGLCLDYLADGEAKKTADTFEALFEALFGGGEYEFLRTLDGFDGSRDAQRRLFKLMCEKIRRAAALRTLASTDASGIEARLAEGFSMRRIMRMYDVVNEYYTLIETNVGNGVAYAAFCAEMFGG